MKAGVRNDLQGTVKAIKKGGVMAQVNLEIPAASQMASVLTLDSVDALGLKVGDKVRVLVKAVSVVLLKE